MDGRAYTKTVLLDGPGGEISLVRWRDGIWSAPHDHGGAAGRVTVLAGRMAERRYAWDAGGALAPAGERVYALGEVLEVGARDVHAMRAEGGGVRCTSTGRARGKTAAMRT